MSKDDSDTTVRELQDEVRRFCEERDWDRFHTPKDLAIGIATEAAELLEIFRFKDEAQCRAAIADPERGRDVRDELSDVLYFVLRFAQMNGIDLTASLRAKIASDAERYPADAFRGRNEKYSELRHRKIINIM